MPFKLILIPYYTFSDLGIMSANAIIFTQPFNNITMNYTSVDELKNAWIFKHKSLPISDGDKNRIKPMTASRAKMLWDAQISKQVDHPDFFKKGDWPENGNSWTDNGKWETIWDSDHEALPELSLIHI